MSTRRWALAVAGAVGLAVTAFAGRAAPPSSMPSAGEQANEARLDELYKKFDELTKNGVVFSPDGGPLSPDRGPDPRTAQRYAETYNAIVDLSISADLAGKNRDYTDKHADLQRERRRVLQEKSLDEPTRDAQCQETDRQIVALNAEYSAVARARLAVQAAMMQRQSRRLSLPALKALLKATDDEWTALMPRLDEILRLKAELQVARAAILGDAAPTPNPKWEAPPKNEPVGELIELLKNEGSDVKDVRTKLESVRKAKADNDARRAARINDLTTKLKAARDRLREMVSAEQTAKLVVERILY